MSDVRFRDRAPNGEALTDYDRDQVATYLRLLDADAQGADWREVARVVLGIDPQKDRQRAELMHATHLARAQWLRDSAYRELLKPRVM